MRKIATYLLFLCLYTEGSAQTNLSPAEAAVLSKTCLKRADWYAHSPQFNRDSTLFYFQKAVDVLEKQPSLPYDKLLEVYSKYIEYSYLSSNKPQTGILSEKASNYYDKISQPSQAQKLLQFDLLRYWALSDVDQKNPQHGLATMTQALSLLDGDNNPKVQAAYFMGKGQFYQRYYNGIGAQTGLSFASLEKARQLYESFNSPNFNQQLVNIYDNLDWNYNVAEKYDSCDYYSAKIKALLPNLNNPYLESRYYILRGNNLYRRERFSEARTFTAEGIQIMKTYGFTNTQLCVFGLYVMGTIELKYKRFDQAERYFNEGRAANLTNNVFEIDYVSHMSDLNEQKGDFKKALAYYKIYSDSMMSYQEIRSEKSIRENELQLNVLKQENKLSQKQKQQTIFIVALVIGALLLGLLYRNYRLKQKTNQQLEVLNGDLADKNTLLDKRNAENELLLREIHHRVKNNLEIVSSLLELQSAQIDDPSVQAAMLSSQNRVHSMGIIHQKLYQKEHLAAIEMRDYFIHLSDNILDSFNANGKIKVECNMPELVLDVDTAVSIGLITNELLTNSLKYAFVGRDSGTIKISLNQQNTEGSLLLKIEDNGVGKQADSTPKGTGFGTQLINLLTRQLDGKLTYENLNGTTVSLFFKRVKTL